RLRDDGGLEEAEAALGAAAEADQVLDLERILGELPDGEHGAVDGERPDDGVHAGAVGEARVGERRALVDAAADRPHDELDHIEELVLVLELDPGGAALAP